MRPLVPLFLLALLVGCTASSALSPAAAPGARVPIALSACAYLETSPKVLTSAVAPLIPPDFVPVTNAAGISTLLFGGANCASAVSGARSGPASFGWASVIIAKPTDPTLQGPQTVSIYLYRLGHYVVEGDLYDQVALEVGAERSPTTIDAAIGETTSTLTMDGHVLDLAPTPHLMGLGALRGTTWREFGSVPGGYAILEARLRTSNDGDNVAGVLTPRAGSVEEQVVGAHSVGSSGYGRAYRIDDGFMQFLPR